MPHDSEAWLLTTDAGRLLLAEVAAVAGPRPADLARWRRGATPERVAAAVRMASCRRRARAKFTRAEAMWLDPVGLEQATAEPVAHHKARRFEGSDVVLDLCSGIGGDAAALAGAARAVLAVDSDQGMARRVRWNADVYGVGDRLASIRARAEAFPIPRGALVHVDPDRRAGTPARGRAKVAACYVPGLDFLRLLARSARGGAIKLGPASDFADHFGGEGFEVELISLDGECKEATAWFGGLATCRRRATTLPAGATWTDREAAGGARMDVSAPLAWLFDPDPALSRSGLLDGFASAHGICRVASAGDLLAGEARVDSPFLKTFEVEAALPFDVKQLRRYVATRGIGTLEIKPRGVGARPEAVRAAIRPEGEAAATLFLIGGPGPTRAVFARRV